MLHGEGSCASGDTNTCIYYLQKQFPEYAEKIIDAIIEENIPIISAITEIALLCWNAPIEDAIKILHQYINDVSLIELEQSKKYTTAEIRKVNRVKLPDAIVEATAITYDLTLITRNTTDLKNIPNLKVLDPFQI